MSLKTMNMLDVYQAVLSTVGYVIDDEGRVKSPRKDKLLPVVLTVEGNSRPVVLPVRAMMKSKEVISCLVFHPMQENLMRGESQVVAFIRKSFNRVYGNRLMYLMNELVSISAGKLNHSELSAEQLAIIGKFGKTDATFAETFTKILRELGKGKSVSTPAMISLRKSFKLNQKTYSRAAIWSFPLAEEVERVISECEKHKDFKPAIFGVKVRKGDLPILKNIVATFFPDYKDVGKYMGTSDATDAPYLESMIRAWTTLPKHTNEIAAKFYLGKYPVVSPDLAAEEYFNSSVDIDWIDEEFKVEKWRKEYLMVPVQEGGEGVEPVGDKVETEVVLPKRSETKSFGEVTEPVTGNAATVAQPTPPAPAQQATAPAAPRHSQFLQGTTAPQYTPPPQPVYHTQPQGQGGNQFLQGAPAPQYAHQYAPPPPPPQNNGTWLQPNQPAYPAQQGYGYAPVQRPAHHNPNMVYTPQPQRPMQYSYGPQTGNVYGAPYGYGGVMGQPVASKGPAGF